MPLCAVFCAILVLFISLRPPNKFSLYYLPSCASCTRSRRISSHRTNICICLPPRGRGTALAMEGAFRAFLLFNRTQSPSVACGNSSLPEGAFFSSSEPCFLPYSRRISFNLLEIILYPVKDCPFQNDKKNNLSLLSPHSLPRKISAGGKNLAFYARNHSELSGKTAYFILRSV